MCDRLYLLQALEEAQKGRGFCSPNPAVGAVAVKNNEIIARGYHHQFGQAHAEINCLSHFDKGTAGVTLYVTLEPCNHFGKTPPCVNAIIEHGIQKVVYAYHDPHEIVRLNDTATILRSHQIETQFLCVPEIEDFYQSYQYWIRHKKPWVTAKWAQTMDGKNGLVGINQHFTHEEAFHFTHLGRYHADILMTTAQTIIADHAAFTARLDDLTVAKPLAILDRHLILTGQEPCFSYSRPIWIFHHQDAQPSFSNSQVQWIAYQHLAEVFTDLAQTGFQDVWVEAGAQMMAVLHQQKLVNTSYIYIAPKVFGAEGTNAFQEPYINFQQAKDIVWFPMGNHVRAKITW